MVSVILVRKFLLPVSLAIGVLLTGNTNGVSYKKDKKVLVFTKTNGFRHSSIPAGIAAIKKLGEENKFMVEATEDSTFFTNANLQNYNAIIFLSTTGDVLGEEGQAAVEHYIKSGGGFAGIHAASDCEYGWPWYVKLIGGNFESHPAPQEAKLIVVNKKHPSTKQLPDVWTRTDEWYNFKNLNPDVTVLIKIDEQSYKGGKNGDNHPMAWYHNYDGGKVFYTELGHTDAAFAEPLLLQHILGGIQSVMRK
jgi:uncharacterized protein